MDGLFGKIGRDGIPAELRRILAAPGGVDSLAQRIIDSSANALGAENYDKGGTRLHPSWLRALSQLLLEWCATEGIPTPAIVLEANAHALSLVSPDTLRPLVPKDLREAMGLPTGANLDSFMLVAAREALALAFHFAPNGPELSDLLARVRAGDWVMSARSLSKETKVKGAKVEGASRATVAEYRGRPEYARIVGDFAGSTLLAWGLSGKWQRMRPMTAEEIRGRVVGIPSSFLLRAIGDYGTSTPPPGAGATLLKALEEAASKLEQ
jgi:hypothetical protein